MNVRIRDVSTIHFGHRPKRLQWRLALILIEDKFANLPETPSAIEIGGTYAHCCSTEHRIIAEEEKGMNGGLGACPQKKCLRDTPSGIQENTLLLRLMKVAIIIVSIPRRKSDLIY